MKVRPQDLDPDVDHAKCIDKIQDDEFIAIDPGNHCSYTWARKNPRANSEKKGKSYNSFLQKTVSKRWYNLRSKMNEKKRRLSRERCRKTVQTQADVCCAGRKQSQTHQLRSCCESGSVQAQVPASTVSCL